MGRVMSKWIDDLLVAAGCVLILIGTYLTVPAATWFIGGGMLIGWGILLGLLNSPRRDK